MALFGLNIFEQGKIRSSPSSLSANQSNVVGGTERRIRVRFGIFSFKLLLTGQSAIEITVIDCYEVGANKTASWFDWAK